jgi:hypothetical protein
VKGLTVFCEGQTERNFCNQLLRRHLFPKQDAILRTILIAHSKHHGRVTRGGVPGRYELVRRDILDELKKHRGRDMFFTTMIDLYGLPKNFPGKKTHRRNPDDPMPYVTPLEEAFDDSIADRRFIPYLQLHEFETILFADPESFRVAFNDCDRAIEELKKLAASFPTIEYINDSQITAPSKRIISLIPDYANQKPSAGPDIAEYTGLPTIRAKCPHFHAWLTRLESLPWS